MISKIKNYSLIVGLVIIGIMYVYIKYQERTLNIWQDKAIVLDEHLNKQVTISNNLLVELRRKGTETVIKKHYVPPEGKIIIKTKREADGSDGDTTFRAKRRGFCFSPGLAVGYVTRPIVMTSTKVFYTSRLGLIVNANHQGVGVGISRHLDDAFFIWHPQNLEGFISYQPIKFTDELPTWLVGLRITF